MSDVKQHILDELFAVLEGRKGSDPETSYVASLYAKGAAKICEKVMEEAQEAVDEALAGNAALLANESADLLFHLMVLWADQGLRPQDIFAVLERRFGIGGHEEKSSRSKN